MPQKYRPTQSGTTKRQSQKLRYLPLLLGLLLATTAWAKSQPAQNIRFDRPFAQEEHLRHQLGGLIGIVQDEFGFMWMSGENGLGRYDGRNLKLYQADTQSPRSLPGNHTWALLVDRDGVFWQAGEGGLSRYHPETDDFTHVTEVGGTTFSSEAVTSLAVAKDNTLYVGGNTGLHAISPDRRTMDVYLLAPPELSGQDVERIRGLSIDPKGRVWIATAGMGAALFDPETRRFEYLLHEPGNSNSPIYANIRTILADNQGRIWMGTFGGGISLLTPDTGQYVHFHRANGLGSDIVVDILQDSEGKIWVALDQGGLALFDENNQSFHHYRHSRHDPHSLISNQLRVLYEDNNKDLWIGAFPSGASFYNRSTQLFRHYIHLPDEPDSLSDDAILNFKQTRDGTIWVGTENGLNALNPKTGKFRRYLSDRADPQALSANPVLSIEEDFDGQLWIGTWAGGLHRFDPETERFTRYPSDRESSRGVKSEFIWDILLASDNTLWVSTEDAGLHRYHRETDSFTQYRHHPNRTNTPSNDYIPMLLEDRRKKLWLATFGGLNTFEPDTETLTRIPYGTGLPNATNSKNIRSLQEDSRGMIWVGTEQQGVDIYDPNTGIFTYLGVADGLLSSNISSIIEDDRGNVWLAATNGLARVDTKSHNISHFWREDGLAGSNYNRNASLKDREGNLYFGSTEGITVFHPDDLDTVTIDFPVYITQFRLFNQEVPIGGNSPLQTSTLVAKNLVLSHEATMFSFELVALNYRQSGSMRYSYRLEGFDQEWHDIGQSTSATYTNIHPGNYRFRTRASTDGENWVEGQSLAITITPSPWRTWWAYGLYSLLIGALLLFAIKYLSLRVRAETYRNKSVTDPLTGLYNRAGIAQIAEGIFANPETRRGMCLMLIDVDYFKDINDRYGHDAGDQILCNLAQAVRDCLRNSDHVGRWGGEEFILLCATKNVVNSRLLAEKVRSTIESQAHETQANLRITVSVGVTDLHPHDSFDSALKRADEALYQAKDEGRNRAVFADA